MDGTEASIKIRNFLTANNLEQPYIMACTGHTEEIYVRDAWKHQIDEVIPKPPKMERIMEILQEVIST